MTTENPGTFEADREPTAEKEFKSTFAADKDHRHLRNRQFSQNIIERRRFGVRAYRMAQTWVSFLMIVVFAQLVLGIFNCGLTEKEFITVVTTTTASVFGFWWLVGRYLFPKDHSD